MQVFNNLVFNGAAGNTGNWINVSQLGPGATLHIVGLETGGSISVFLSNSLLAPLPEDATVVAGTVTTGIAGDDGGAPQLVLANAIMAQWLQLVKTPGGSPTTTTVRMVGQLL